MKYLITVLLLVIPLQASAYFNQSWNVAIDEKKYGATINLISTVSENLNGKYSLTWQCITDGKHLRTELILNYTSQGDAIAATNIRVQIDANPIFDFEIRSTNYSKGIALTLQALDIVYKQMRKGSELKMEIKVGEETLFPVFSLLGFTKVKSVASSACVEQVIEFQKRKGGRIFFIPGSEL